MGQARALLTLLSEFMRFGCFTFGGGWSIVAQMQQTYVDKKKTLTMEELIDMTSVAKSLPGTMIGNVAMLYGYRAGGLAGGLVCVLGMALPPMAILILISYGYSALRSNYWVMAAMEGMQAAVAPVIASAAAGMVRGSLRLRPCVLVMLLCFALYLFWDVSAVILVLTGGVFGLLIGEYEERKGAGKHGAA